MTFKSLILRAPEGEAGLPRLVKDPVIKARQPTAAELAVNFDTGQLPQLDDPDSHPAEATKPEAKVTLPAKEKEEPVEVKLEEDKIAEAAEVVKKVEGELEVEKKVEGEEGHMRFLKPPPGAKKEDGKRKTKAELEAEIGDLDITGFDAPTQETLKHMSKISRKHFVDVLNENKALKQKGESQWYQQPDAFKLHPGYQAAQRDVALADFEGRHWMQQLELAKLGKPLRSLESYDQTGKPIYKDIPAGYGSDVEELIRSYVGNCQRVKNDRQAAIQNHTANFSKAVAQDQVAIKAERARRFAWIANPKLMKYSVPLEDGTEQTIETVRNNFIGMFPSYMHSNEGVQTAADMMVSMMIGRAEVAEYKKKSGVTQVKKEEADLGEVTSSTRGKPPVKLGKGKVGTFTMEGAGIEI